MLPFFFYRPCGSSSPTSKAGKAGLFLLLPPPPSFPPSSPCQIPSVNIFKLFPFQKQFSSPAATFILFFTCTVGEQGKVFGEFGRTMGGRLRLGVGGWLGIASKEGMSACPPPPTTIDEGGWKVKSAELKDWSSRLIFLPLFSPLPLWW